MWEDKETTAPDPSVAPDGEQPSALARTDSIATFEETNKQFGKMRIFSMPELMDTHFPSRPCIIENLLPAGTYLLAGAPKIGKSFLVLQMAYQVSAGEPFLGFPSRHGTVLYTSNPDIDLSRTAQNFHLVTPRWSYEQEIKHRIQTAGCRVRKDSVKFVDTLVTVSPEFAKAHEAEMPEYFRRAFDFLKERVGEENIISAVVHMDEKTPHMHLCFVPLTRDKRLSAKEILGNKKSMIRWQDDFYACMAERWPELERGTPAVETKRRHLIPQWYKKVTAMDAKLEQLDTTLNNINVFNASKKREEAVALLAQLLPEVESFQAETQRLRDTIAHERQNASFQREINADLRNELKAERSHSFDQSMKLSELERRYKRAEKLLDKVPPEVLEHIKRKATARER